MNNDINLLPKTRQHALRSNSYILIFQRISIVFLIFTIAAAIGSFFLRLSDNTASLKQQENAYLTSISFQHTKIAKVYFIENRVQQIDSLVATRLIFSDIITAIKSNIDASTDVKLDAIVINKYKIEVDATSHAISVLNDFIEKTTPLLNQRKSWRKTIINSFVADRGSGSYHVTIEADYL